MNSIGCQGYRRQVVAAGRRIRYVYKQRHSARTRELMNWRRATRCDGPPMTERVATDASQNGGWAAAAAQVASVGALEDLVVWTVPARRGRRAPCRAVGRWTRQDGHDVMLFAA